MKNKKSSFEELAKKFTPGSVNIPDEARVLARAIDHTNLKKDASDEDIAQLCREATEFGFASVCVRPEKVKLASELFKKWGVKDVSVCAVIDFPNKKGDVAGKASPEEKAKETKKAIMDGAREIDMVLDYEAILNGDIERALGGVKAVVETARQLEKELGGKIIVKIIMETALLRARGGESAIKSACETVIAGGADFGKTSTGFAVEGGASLEDVRILAKELKPKGIKVKASGGIKTAEDAEKMLKTGADRLGMSAGAKIMKEKIKNCA